MAQKKVRIDGSMLISEVVSLYPGTIPVFMEYGLHCIGCSIAASETVSEGARSHGMDDERLASFLSSLNLAAEAKGKKRG
ncbi:Uncharacterised protein [uncultured archaeon]|nr:Uncharacterised protein [uncultured archaeon]